MCVQFHMPMQGDIYLRYKDDLITTSTSDKLSVHFFIFIYWPWQTKRPMHRSAKFQALPNAVDFL